MADVWQIWRYAVTAGCAAELKEQQGEWRLANPVVWVDPQQTTPEQVTLLWDFAVRKNWMGGDDQPIVRGEAVPALEGRLGIELFVGDDPDSMHSVAQLSNVGTRGSWNGLLPLTSGFARAVVSWGDRVLFGELCEIKTGRNLTSEAGLLKSFLSARPNEVEWKNGGPVIDGEFLSFHSVDSGNGAQDSFAVGPAVPITPGHEFLLEGWLRATSDYPLNLGWRYLDRGGKSIASSATPANVMGDRLWIRCVQVLRPPPNVAFIEPILHGNVPCDVAGLSIIELPPTQTSPEP